MQIKLPKRNSVAQYDKKNKTNFFITNYLLTNVLIFRLYISLKIIPKVLFINRVAIVYRQHTETIMNIYHEKMTKIWNWFMNRDSRNGIICTNFVPVRNS